MSELHFACRQGKSLPEIKALVEQDPSALQLRDDGGNLPFHCACGVGGCSLEVLRYLAEQDESSAKATQEEDFESTALHLFCLHSAATKEQAEIVRFLVEMDRSALKARDYHYGLPLHNLTSNPLGPSKEALEVLIQACPDAAKELDCTGMTPLFNLCKNKVYYDEARLARHRQEMIRVLVATHPEALDIPDNKGETPMTWMERTHPPTFEVMKAMETPDSEMILVQLVQQELKEARETIEELKEENLRLKQELALLKSI